MDNETQEAKVYRPSGNDFSKPLGQIARYVAATGQILNIGDVATWLKKDVQSGNESIKSILCMPIVNGQRTVIGVAQLINKVIALSLYNNKGSIWWLTGILMYRITEHPSPTLMYQSLKHLPFSVDLAFTTPRCTSQLAS